MKVCQGLFGCNGIHFGMLGRLPPLSLGKRLTWTTLSWKESETGGCFRKSGVSSMGVIVIRTLLVASILGPLIFGNSQMEICFRKARLDTDAYLSKGIAAGFSLIHAPVL